MGCGLVRWGLWIELLAVAYMICLFGYLVTSFVDKPGVKPEVLKSMGLFVIVPFFYLTLIGTGFIALGRTRMLSLPPGTGAGGVLTGAFVLSGLRALAVLASAALVTQAAMAWPDTSFDKMGRYLVLGVGSWLISIVPGVIAELTVVPGLAIAGGSIPSLRLRRRTGRFAFVLQVVALAFVFLGVLGYFGLASILSRNVSVRDIVQGQGAVQTPAGAPSPSDVRAGLMVVQVVLAFLLFLQFVYAWLQAGMYRAGQAAVIEARQAEEASEDNSDDR